jgi:hypothetical protein
MCLWCCWKDLDDQLGNSRQMDLSGPGIDVKLKERKKER